MATKIPSSNSQWLNEIAKAYLDAKEAMPFGPLAGTTITENDLFQLAPVVCLKFRGIDNSKENETKAVDAALSSYVANENENGGILKRPPMGFAFCYMLSHYGLDLIDDEQCEKILIYIENNLNELENKIKI